MPMTNTEVRKRSVTKTLKVSVNLALLALLVWFLVAHKEKIRVSVSGRDSIAYWATGKLLVHRQNPYSQPTVLALEKGQGYRGEKPLMLRPLPWSTWMVLPLGLLSAYWAWAAWIAVLIASLVITMRVCWRMYGDSPSPPVVFLLAGYLFAPVAACLVAGQMGIVLLLGVVLFFLWEEEHSFLAGAALVIPFVKPHIFSLVWPILAVWVITRKKWSPLAGSATALAIACLIALAFDPAIFQHYHEMLGQEGIQHQFIPALSGMLRLIFFRRFFWTQFVPLGLGFLWSARYYWTNRETWNWRQHGPALLVVAVLTTPYSWISDEVVVLPAILQGVVWMGRVKLKAGSQFVILLLVCLDLLVLVMVRFEVRPDTGMYFWSSLVWFSWYFYARRFREAPALQNAPVAVVSGV